MHSNDITSARVHFTCPTCGTSFWRYRSQTEASVSYCSKACRPARIADCLCEECGAAFQVPQSRLDKGQVRYCSRGCQTIAYKARFSGENNPAWSGRPLTSLCVKCRAAFQSDSYGNGRQQKYCSHACYSLDKLGRTAELSPSYKGGPLPRTCRHCGEVFTVKRWVVEKGLGLYCSQVCQHLVLATVIGPAHPNWRGGKKCERHTEMERLPYRDWRRSVFERDDFTCQHCGRRGGRLNAHHIQPWKSCPDRRYDVENGVTLCKPCHVEAHRPETP